MRKVKFVILIRRYACAVLPAFLILLNLTDTARAQDRAMMQVAKPGANYRIGVDDVLQVMVVKQPLLSTDNVRVANDGTIQLPMIESGVAAACLTETELSAAILAKYKKYLLDPQVYVSVKEYNANPVALIGAVVAPGRFQLQRPTRLLELLTRVNGPAQNAGKTVQIFRGPAENRCDHDPTLTNAAEGDQDIIWLSLADVLKGDEKGNPFLQAGDIVRIPEAELQQAFVLGNVRSAVTINLKEPITLSKAIALAGGVAPGANTSKVKISRQEPNSLAKTEMIVSLKDIEKRIQDDILLKPDDIVDVPGPSGTRRILNSIFRSVIPVVTRMPVVIP
ncbi:MAG: polysaccharide biosynthesis/export family protein [Pyrinomonadaceae bacterium]